MESDELWTWTGVAMRKKWTVVVYSQSWVYQIALEHICRIEKLTLHYNPCQVFSDFSGDCQWIPGIVILDISPRESVGIILKIRKKWPGVYIFFTRQRFLFSDRVVADFFGGIWLKEYDALMAGLPGVGFSHNLISPLFSGGYAPARDSDEQQGEEKMMRDLDFFLHQRLSAIVTRRGADIVLQWLIKNIPLAEICRLTGLKEKTVYHYRELTMKRLGIRHFSRDFIASLTISRGMHLFPS